MQPYVAVPIEKTIDDLFNDPALAYLYSDTKNEKLPDEYEWIVNDVARLLELAGQV